MTYTTYGTLSGSSYGFAITPQTAGEKPTTPPGLIVTQAVQTRHGWLGQVLVDKQIVWESDLDEDGEAAVQVANARVVEAVTWLLRDAGEATS